MASLTKNIILKHLPALRSLDFGIKHYEVGWPRITTVIPLTYLRLELLCISTLIRLISTPPLANTLRQLHVKVCKSDGDNNSDKSISSLLTRMVNLHTFTFVQKFFCKLTSEWTNFEMLTSSNIMPVLRRANVSIFININNLNRISSSSLFTDHRHIDVHFAFHLINCPQYTDVTQFIPHGNRFHPREIVGATFVVNQRSGIPPTLTNNEPFVSCCSLLVFALISQDKTWMKRKSLSCT